MLSGVYLDVHTCIEALHCINYCHKFIYVSMCSLSAWFINFGIGSFMVLFACFLCGIANISHINDIP